MKIIIKNQVKIGRKIKDFLSAMILIFYEHEIKGKESSESVFRFQSVNAGESFVQFGFFFYPLLFFLFLLNRLDGYTV